jgi:hypothetical protein
MKRVGFLVLVAFAGCSSDPNDGGGAVPDGGVSTPDASVVDSGGKPDTGLPVVDAGIDGAVTCTAAKEQLLKPIKSVATGEVTVLSETAGVKTVYVDGSAGGPQAAATNPRLYLNLETMTKVAVTDVTAETSTGWDVALKRPILFTNGGAGGPGSGGAVFLAGVDFDGVASADANGKTFAKEVFFDADCNPQVDPTGAVKTSFDGWYDYNTADNTLTPKAGTWLVKGGTGKLFKVQILSYYATPDGGTGMAGGRYTLRVAAL